LEDYYLYSPSFINEFKLLLLKIHIFHPQYHKKEGKKEGREGRREEGREGKRRKYSLFK
jgi:hypothetical protein